MVGVAYIVRHGRSVLFVGFVLVFTSTMNTAEDVLEFIINDPTVYIRSNICLKRSMFWSCTFLNLSGTGQLSLTSPVATNRKGLGGENFLVFVFLIFFCLPTRASCKLVDCHLQMLD